MPKYERKCHTYVSDFESLLRCSAKEGLPDPYQSALNRSRDELARGMFCMWRLEEFMSRVRELELSLHNDNGAHQFSNEELIGVAKFYLLFSRSLGIKLHADTRQSLVKLINSHTRYPVHIHDHNDINLIW